MPRKNNREQFEPLDLTSLNQPEARPRIGSQWTPFSDTQQRKRDDETAERRRRQERARINGGIDWAVCLVPGCGMIPANTQRFQKPEWRDHTLNLPLCSNHLAAAYTQARWKPNDPLMVNAVAVVVERDRAKTQTAHEARKKAWLTKTDGHIYYVRLNGIIKVGWSRTIADRLRAYGPSVELLVLYEGTRDDETNLHRQLKPARARGHEWYEDGPILADFIAKAIEQHGKPPDNYDSWTRPKQIVAGKRHKRSA